METSCFVGLEKNELYKDPIAKTKGHKPGQKMIGFDGLFFHGLVVENGS